ncbi:putative RNase H-like nuclease (RuvC/YqgF family) [Pelomonas saccharophila]|uniref:RNase H-like nuclease (RuvC/YqgF family) n=1 Tax=Roseateles saccharophilus TaxID=304 RepID=A0ABU1YPG8_ROSSA|nr:hypothetical protein [Roseateles saccharophilus]MDR7270758.1 putative RNase H-like nuclease (RuvC/YqgF family) [Roseateles saccharophilus]
MHSVLRARTLALFTVLAALAAASHAQATSGPRYGSKEDLRQCMDGEDRIKLEQAALQKKADKRKAVMKQWQDEMRAHVALQATVDKSDEDAITAYNERMDALNARVEPLNREAVEFQASVDAFDARTQEFNKRCAGLVYRINDMRAIEKERLYAAKAKAGKS